MLPLNLPFTVLRVALRALEPVHLPPFPGSKLEGAFGRALYRLACIQPQRKTCQDCPLQAIYPYGLSYAPWLPEDLRVSSLGTPRPIDGEERHPEPRERLTFGLVVVGRAVSQLPCLLAALREVSGQGLGRTGAAWNWKKLAAFTPTRTSRSRSYREWN